MFQYVSLLRHKELKFFFTVLVFINVDLVCIHFRGGGVRFEEVMITYRYL